MPRLWIDENLAYFVQPLRDEGHDVVDARETGLSASDARHFREAVRGQRIILTLDSDFYYLHGLWMTLETLGVVDTEHSGILTALQTRVFSIPDWLGVVQEKLASGEALQGRMLTWHTSEAKWDPEIRPPWRGLI